MKKHLISFGIMMVLTLGLIIAATYSWMAINKNVDSSGIDINLKPASTISRVSCYALKYDGIDKASFIELSDEVERVSMSEYDTIFTDRNYYAALIIRVVINVSGDVATNANGKIKLVIPCTGDYKDSNNKIINNISNVLEVRAGCGLGSSKAKDEYGNTVNNSNKAAIFNGALEALNLNGTATDVFVKNGAKDTIVIEVPQSEYSMYVPANTQASDTVSIVLNIGLNYKDSLVNDYTTSNGADAREDFSADIGTIEIDWETN